MLLRVGEFMSFLAHKFVSLLIHEFTDFWAFSQQAKSLMPKKNGVKNATCNGLYRQPISTRPFVRWLQVVCSGTTSHR